MEKAGFWAAMSLVRNIALVAVRRGADLNDVCRAVGVEPDTLDDPNARANLDQCIKAWEQALRYSGDPFLGLHLGDMTSPGLVGIVGYFMESSPDLLTAFQNLVQFKRLIDNAPSFTEIKGEEFSYHSNPYPLWTELSPETARHVVEHTIATIPHFVKLLCGKPIQPLRVHFAFARPRDTREYLRVLKTEPLFDQPSNCIVFRLSDMRLPLISHNPALNAIFKELLEKEMAKLSGSARFSDELRGVILKKFVSTIPQLPEVAEQLHVTPRTLQRRLKEEGATFQSVVESVKSELAIGMLKKPGLTVSEIAYKLGYMEPNVFRRAFKKWTGVSPKAYG